MTRRAWILGAGAAALAAAGGLAWRLRQESLQVPPAETAMLWSRRFEQPDGTVLDLARLRGRPLLVNFWATWCPPCVEEMPEIDRFHRSVSGRGWQVLGLAVDRAGPVRDFLARQPVGFLIALAGFDGSELSRQMGNTGGALPFTVLIDAKGRIVQRKLGQTHFEELSTWASMI